MDYRLKSQQSNAAINNMPHPPQYGVTPAIIGELITLNPRGGGALDLRMRICIKSMRSAQIALCKIAWSMLVHMRTLITLIVLLASTMSTTAGRGDEKTVLVSLGQRTRPVTFCSSSPDALENAIRQTFADSPLLTSTNCEVIVQVLIAVCKLFCSALI